MGVLEQMEGSDDAHHGFSECSSGRGVGYSPHTMVWSVKRAEAVSISLPVLLIISELGKHGWEALNEKVETKAITQRG